MAAPSTISFSPRLRVLPCPQCGAAVTVPPEGGEERCGRCSTAVAAPPRPETTVPKSPATDERARRERLRPQDGKPMLPPAGLETLVSGSEIPPHRMQEALMLYAATCKHLAAQPADIAAAERLVWLVALLANTYVDAKDEAALRAVTEGAMEVLMLPRHRQQMRARLAGMAARAGDTRSAEQWLAGCDPASEDLQTDSAYRVARALADTALRRPEAVLEVLGADEHEVPIEDARDAFATVLRAHALEQRGDLEGARTQLARYMTGGGGRSGVVDSIVALLPADWNVCAQSLQTARQEVRQKVGARAAGGMGGEILGFIILAGGSVPLVILVIEIVDGTFFMPMLAMLLFPVIFGGWGLKMIRGARRARAIARDGIHAKGRIVSVAPTGTRINHVPVMRLDLELDVDGHGRRKASAKRLCNTAQAAMLVGREVGVIWHPKYPDEVVVDL